MPPPAREGDDSPGSSSFLRHQRAYFSKADPAHFVWSTTDTYLSPKEVGLLRLADIKETDGLLEVGCGEGGNLYWLSGRSRGAVGLDYSFEKVAFASQRVPRAAFLCGDATRLPLRSESRDVILCRDVLHHVQDKHRVVAEMMRVARRGGRVVIIEPNGRNPVIAMQALLVRAERNALKSTEMSLRALLRDFPLERVGLVWDDPFPLGRALFHYRWGLPALSRGMGKWLAAAERVLSRLTTQQSWSYMVWSGVRSR